MRLNFLVFMAPLLFGPFSLVAQTHPIITLHNFTNGIDGGNPTADLVLSEGMLYGTSADGVSGSGTIFSLNTNGSGLTNLHSFSSRSDGASQIASLVLSSGILYGTAENGGIWGNGTVFAVNADGTGFTNLHNFASGAFNKDNFYTNSDGYQPTGGLVLSGNMLYGTANQGGPYGIYGTVFAIGIDGIGFTNLHSFTGYDGAYPAASLILSDHTLYGTTQGTIFAINTDGTQFTNLHSFAGGGYNNDGVYTNNDGSILSCYLTLAGGRLYGIATEGGIWGNGTVFSINTNGSDFTNLHSFAAGGFSGEGFITNGEGTSPTAGLVLSKDTLYGTAESGGVYGNGTVFSLNTNGNGFTTMYDFSALVHDPMFGDTNSDGANPHAGLTLSGNTLYGATYNGGSEDGGTVFGLQLSGVVFTLEPVGATNVAIGSNVVFTAAGESLSFPTATLQYQWRLNGIIIPGATTTELTFQDVQPTNGGTLTVTVSDGINAATSVPVGLSAAIPTMAAGNTNFAKRYVLTQASSSVVGSSNTNGTEETGEPQIITGNPGGKPIWFQWQPTNSGTAIFTTLGSDFDTILGVYIGTNISALTRVPSCINDDDSGGFLTSKVEFNCVAGTAYEVVVDGYWGASGNVVLSWATESFAEPLPSLLVVPPRQTVASNGAAATLVCQPDSGVPSWFFNGEPTGVTGPDFPISAVGDANVGTYVAQTTLGGAVASTQPAHVQINVLEDGTSDPNSIAWNKFLDSANSPYSNPPQSSIRKLGGGGDTRGFSVSQTFSTVGALSEPGEPSIAGQIGGSPYWYTYVTPTNGALLINTAGSSFNTLLGVFTGSGNSFATLTNVGAGYTTNRLLNGQPQVYIPNVPKGQTDFIVVDGYNGASGTVHLNITLGDPVVISMPPQNQFVPAGSNAAFTVSADGSTPLSYFWQFNGTNIAGATNAGLIISNAQSANIGVYTVVVSNLVSVTRNSATLSLLNTLLLETPAFNGGEFQIQLIGAPGGGYVLQTSTNLQTWTSLVTNNITNGFLLLTDTNASNFDRRFYRAVAN